MIWRLTYCNKEGVEARIDIIKGNRTPVEVVQGSGNPFTLSYKLDKNDKSGHIMTSSADIEIFETETFNIDDLKTSNETELKVEYFEDNILTWSGFILPDFFSREIGSPNIVRMTASDRLTALKGVTLSDLPSRVSLRNLIELSLSQTGLSLGLASQIQINQGSTNILDSEVLSQRFTDVKGRSINCYDILLSIMVATNSTIRQRKGQWQVYNKLEHELRTPTIFFDKVEKGAIRTIQPVASSVGVYNEFGGNRLHPNNYDFSLGLANWTGKNGFNGSIDNKVVSYFLGGTPIYQLDVTTSDYLVNLNNWITNETNLDTAPFLESNNIPIASAQNNTVEVEVDISAVMAEKLSSNTATSFLRYAIIATNGIDTYAMTPSGVFETYDPEKINENSIVLKGGIQEPLFLASPPFTHSDKRSVTLDVEDVNDFHINIRIYGSGLFQYVNVNFASIKFGNKTDVPKGNLYKTTQGSNFTKLHDVETTTFGDYIRSGLNGYFYNYPIDDTSNLYLPNGELSPPEWETVFDATERPLLHHISRQKSRLFSVAHDILKANINVESFDPLAVFQDCRDRKYVVVSAIFDFLRSEVDVELEQIAYDNEILKRDFIYSYFGEGEDTIKSIGGIAGGGGGTGGAGGGGMTSEQLEMLTNLADWWKLDEENDAIYSEKSVYSLKGVSAFGYGDDGGGGDGNGQNVEWGETANNYSPLTVGLTEKTVALSGHKHTMADITDFSGGGEGGSTVEMEDVGTTAISLTVDGVTKYISRTNHIHNIFTLEGINSQIGFTDGYVLTWDASTSKLILKEPSGGSGGGGSVSWGDIIDKPSTFAPSSHTHSQYLTEHQDISNLATKTELAGKANTSHTHTIVNVTGLQSALNAKQNTLIAGTNITISGNTISASGGMSSVAWGDITGKPSTFAPSSHTHSQYLTEHQDISNLATKTELAGKANTSHTHTIVNVTGLQSALNAKQNTLIAGTNITISGNTISASGGMSSVAWGDITGKPSTFPPSGHTHSQYLTEHQDISNLATKTELAGKANTSHTHTIANVAGLQTALDAKAPTHNTTMTGTTTVAKISFGNGWTLEPNGTEMTLKYSGATRIRFTSDGNIITVDDLIALG